MTFQLCASIVPRNFLERKIDYLTLLYSVRLNVYEHYGSNKSTENQYSHRLHLLQNERNGNRNELVFIWWQPTQFRKEAHSHTQLLPHCYIDPIVYRWYVTGHISSQAHMIYDVTLFAYNVGKSRKIISTHMHSSFVCVLVHCMTRCGNCFECMHFNLNIVRWQNFHSLPLDDIFGLNLRLLVICCLYTGGL